MCECACVRVQRDASQNNINCLRVPEQLEMHAQDNTQTQERSEVGQPSGGQIRNVSHICVVEIRRQLTLS